MNQPTLAAVDKMLSVLGNSSLQLGNGSIGLIAAPFTPAPTLTLANLTEATFHGYSRQALGNPTATFTGGDGNEYVEFTTAQFLCSDTVSPNTIYGLFLTFGNSTTALWATDPFPAPLPMASPANQITITPRVGLNPTVNFGLNVISN
jgi:hypothetical protein